jgi:AcrR family transcriptional regulator
VARVTREESQANTRSRLLDAAAEEFASKGFGGASLDRIADAAGFTRGAVYSNFDGKADLFVAVLDQRLDRQFDEIGKAMADAGAELGAFVDTLRSVSWTTRNPPALVLQWMQLYDEFRLYALRNPKARPALARHEQRLRESYARAARSYLEPLGLVGVVPDDVVGTILFALDHDLNRQEVIDPKHVPRTAFADALAFLVDAARALATSGGSRGRPSSSPGRATSR